MIVSFEKIVSAHCRQYQSWIFAPARESYRRLALYLLEDLFLAGWFNRGRFVFVSVSGAD
jgi:hypothetical protein